MNGRDFTAMGEAIDEGLKAVKGHQDMRFMKFLIALQGQGYDVHKMPDGPIAPKNPDPADADAA